MAEKKTIALDPAQRQRVEEEAIKSANAGVRSVPHFVFGGSITINGGRNEDEIAAAIQAASGAIIFSRYRQCRGYMAGGRVRRSPDALNSPVGSIATSP